MEKTQILIDALYEIECRASATLTGEDAYVMCEIASDALLKHGTLPDAEAQDSRITMLKHGNRTHEECDGCSKVISTPAICSGHVDGPSSCSEFEEPSQRDEDESNYNRIVGDGLSRHIR